MQSSQSTPASRVTLTATLLVSVLYLLYFNLGPGVPLRQNGLPPPGLAMVENLLADVDATMIKAAGDKNLELHFGGPADARANHGLRFAEMYYSGNYSLYPRGVIVGKADRVINSQDELLPADVVPDDRWLTSHRVAGVLTVTPAPDSPETFEKQFHPVP